jgi:hypothetical protein
VERFHVVVGATRSSTLTVRFKFYVDKEDVIGSRTFDLSIARPRGYRHGFKDGDEFRREDGRWVLSSS